MDVIAAALVDDQVGGPEDRQVLRDGRLRDGKLGDELLDREIFYTLQEVQVLTEEYRRTYNRVRPHSSLGYRPPAPRAVLAVDMVPALVGLT